MTPADGERRLVGDLSICRIVSGMWQVAGGHGRIDPRRAVAAMAACHEAGFTSWNLADHDGPAEDLIGIFRRYVAAQRGEVHLGEIKAFTKWVRPRGR
jgi:aryl-alcohol dehydrogenase-like predicted oxidoreductase